MLNHSLTHKGPRRTWRSIVPSIQSGSWVAEWRWGIFLRLMRLVQFGGKIVGVTRFMRASVSRRHLAVRMEAALSPCLRLMLYVCLEHFAMIDVYVVCGSSLLQQNVEGFFVLITTVAQWLQGKGNWSSAAYHSNGCHWGNWLPSL